MSHMILELILWMLLVFFIGCIIGYLARRLFSPVEATKSDPTPVTEREITPPPIPHEPEKLTMEPVTVIMAAPVEPPAPAQRAAFSAEEPPVEAERPAMAEPIPAVAAVRPERPKGIAKPREGQADNLQRISGIGPKYERTLHNLGFYHFDQIAVWTAEQVDWVDDHLKFNGRIRREEWAVQARLLADGKEEEFLAKYGTGGLRSKTDDSKSGTRTRRR